MPFQTNYWENSERECYQCNEQMKVKTWESSDGAYEDLKYWCPNCDHSFWVEGIDA